MLIPTLLLSFVFSSLAFIVTKSNARYILSGYNTMSNAQRAAVDIDGYLKFHKQFHLFLGISVFVCVMSFEVFNKNLAGIFLGMYPLIAYVYFLIKSRKYFSGVESQKIGATAGVLILVLTIGGTGYLFLIGLKNSEILIKEDNLEITGMYGEKISRDKILGVRLISDLPEITMRSNGFSAGDFRKGYFRTKDRKTVKLIVNKKQKPVIVLDTREGEIYFSTTGQSSEDLIRKIVKWRGL